MELDKFWLQFHLGVTVAYFMLLFGAFMSHMGQLFDSSMISRMKLLQAVLQLVCGQRLTMWNIVCHSAHEALVRCCEAPLFIARYFITLVSLKVIYLGPELSWQVKSWFLDCGLSTREQFTTEAVPVILLVEWWYL